MSRSPFVHGGPVAPADFLDRRRELRRLINRLEQGQATAVVGQPHTGKTSLLRFVLDKVKRDSIAGPKLEQCWFRDIDSQMLSKTFNQAAFWEHVLEPIVVYFDKGELHDLYETSRQNEFSAFTLMHLFAAMDKANVRIVIMLDEFDALLSHPILNSAEFYGSLRSLSSRFSSLALIIATRRSLNQLNVQTQSINPHSSPYFNVFTELRLGALPKSDAATLLAHAGDRFSTRDREFVTLASGRHPYLLQLTADLMWEAVTEVADATERYQQVAEELRMQSEGHFADTWRSWSNAERKVVIAISLAQISELAEEHRFDWSNLIEDISDYSPEIRGLEKSGTIVEVENGKWQVTQGAMLWWLADEIKRQVRDEAT
ncbi:MAG: AAA family ATPase [Candidatus Promineifilaceae bacterium]